ncbi:MAG TPA: DNA repair protein RecN [Sphingobacteriaceae bacterium]|nr:DNA repair protein RecN [Sphingobacteriaceae bacterium]
MLNRLVIQNYALIDNLDISFSKELNILTGETGAGKSIILGALSLILGQRAESKYFFNQQKKCVIEGHFHIPDFHLKDFFSINDLDYEEITVLRREITVDKSRAFINDTPVNLTILKQLGECLIDIHSQHATLEINDEGFQLLAIDTLAGNKDLLIRYREIYNAFKRSSFEFKELIAQSTQSKSEMDFFQFQFNELEKAQLAEDEQEHIETELNILTHAEEIKRHLIGATLVLNGQEQSSLTLLHDALQQMQHSEKYNPQIEALSERLKSSIIEIKDISFEVEQIEKNTQFNELRFNEINDRLNTIYSLQKKHGVNSNKELLEIQNEISDKLSAILFADDKIDKLQQEVMLLKKELLALAEQLNESRNEILPKFEKLIQATLNEIGMPNAVLKVDNIFLSEDQLNTTGRNTVRFLFSANKGQLPAPMNKVASGGELSRLMLSIKSLIARHAALPTIIFDEIDTGISGEVALKVGTIMERLSLNMQVITITHLPQIASKGKAHYKVFKDDSGDRTLTNINLLTDDERITEVAKMLSGKTPGEFALQNARELLAG